MMYMKYASGFVATITGPMFSGKSEELIRRIKILGYANENILVIKSSIDNRWDNKKIISRAGSSIDTKLINNPKEILEIVENGKYSVIAIDEAQFFDNSIVKIVNSLANKGIRIIISGLDRDFKAKPFGPMPDLLAISDNVTKLHAICFRCGKAATHTYRINKDSSQVVIGNSEYEARCRECYVYGETNK